MRQIWVILLTAAPLFGGELAWKSWSDDIFVQARREHRFVLLDLEAVWCHWCHVMDETTYRDPATRQLLEASYLTVRVDQDSRPDLSNRYEDYGWPATIVFDSEGREIVKRRGYIPPRQMVSMSQAIIDDPSPGPSVIPEQAVPYAADGALAPRLREQLQQRYRMRYDARQGGWGFDQKFLDWDSVEYAIALARTGDGRAGRMARQTLEAQRQLIDPVWGGVYQYSTGGVWTQPHFEKIMLFQAENLNIYALAYEQWRRPEYLQAALDIHRFLTAFLTSPDGAFYASMDADLIEGQHSAQYFALKDAERRKLGIPRVDQHVYARENGWAIAALGTLYEATGETSYLAEAKRAAEWVLQNRSLPGGGFRHGTQDPAGPYLGDTLAMSRAFLKLYECTGDREWLRQAGLGLHFIQTRFRNENGAGFLTSATATDSAYQPHPERDENISLARTANLLSYYTGDRSLGAMADQAMRYAVAIAGVRQYSPAGVLLADREMTRAPMHLTITGHKDDPAARLLFQAALGYPSAYKRVDWRDPREGALPNPDVEYPDLPQAAAFICTETSCSSPITKPELLVAKANRLAEVDTKSVKDFRAAAARAR